jgi:hypothetical protein
VNEREAQEALLIGEALGLDITVQGAGDDGNIRLLVLDGINAPRRISAFSVFTERYGSLEMVMAEQAAAGAELEMDEATAAALAESMLGLSAAHNGDEVAPVSVLPDTPNRVRHALGLALDAEWDHGRERSLMDAMIDLEAFVPDSDVPAPGGPVDRDVLRDVGNRQTAAIVAITGVNGWRPRDGVPAAIGSADRAFRLAISSQAGYTASGVPAMFLGLLTTGIVALIAVVVAVVSSTSLLAAVGATVLGLVAAVAVLEPAARLGRTYAAANYLDRNTPAGRRAHRLMRVVWQLPAIAAVARAAAGFTIAALLLG